MQRFRITTFPVLFLFGLAALIGVVPSLRAGGSQSGKITHMLFLAGGQVFVRHAGVRYSIPGCASNPAEFAIDASTPQGKTQAAGLMMAYSTGRNVEIYGMHHCAVWGDRETINYFVVID